MATDNAITTPDGGTVAASDEANVSPDNNLDAVSTPDGAEDTVTSNGDTAAELKALRESQAKWKKQAITAKERLSEVEGKTEILGALRALLDGKEPEEITPEEAATIAKENEMLKNRFKSFEEAAEKEVSTILEANEVLGNLLSESMLVEEKLRILREAQKLAANNGRLPNNPVNAGNVNSDPKRMHVSELKNLRVGSEEYKAAMAKIDSGDITLYR